MSTAYEQRRERERWDPGADHGPGHETDDEQLERRREDWRTEIDRDLEDER
jgi:hypothetical protein